MKKKIIWMMISGLMVLTLILTSCETKTTEKTTEDETEDTVKITESETTTGTAKDKEEVTTKPSDIPQYGGTHNIALAFDVTNWANGLEFC